jgi:hypothetical protein
MEEGVGSSLRQQVGGVGKPVAIAADVTGWGEAQIEALDVLIGVVARPEVGIHDGLHHFVGEVQPGAVQDGHSHCC